MAVKRNGDRIRVAPADWTTGKSVKVGYIKDGILYNASKDILGFRRTAEVSVEVIDDAENLGFHSVHFDKADNAGNQFVGDIPVSEVRKCEKVRIGDWPECYGVPLEWFRAVGKKPAETVGSQGEAEKQA